MNKNILPEFITLKEININTSSETNGFNLLNLNTKELVRVINLLLKRVFELGEQQDMTNVINMIISALENSKKHFHLPHDLGINDLPVQTEFGTYIFETRREDDFTYSITRIEEQINIDWDTSAIITQVKTYDGILANASVITKSPQILIQFATIPNEDHWIYIL